MKSTMSLNQKPMQRASLRQCDAHMLPTARRMSTKRAPRLTSVQAVESASKTGSMFIDYDQAFASSTYPIAPEKLIEMTKTILALGPSDGMAVHLAPDYQFIGPVVGPLGREEFLAAIKNISFKTGFPDLCENYFGFHVDPMETNRVWFMSRGRGTNIGKFFGIEPTGNKYEGAPEILSFTFNKDGKITKQTIGVCADRTQGNTGGLGGAFGMLYAVGKPLPFPEAQPWAKSWQYSLFSFLGSLARR